MCQLRVSSRLQKMILRRGTIRSATSKGSPEYCKLREAPIRPTVMSEDSKGEGLRREPSRFAERRSGTTGAVKVAMLLILAHLLLVGPTLAVEKPERIKVIGTGKAQGTHILKMWFTTEPSTDPLIIPSRDWGGVTPEMIKRLLRIYFPRTYEELLAYEFYFMAQVDMSYFSPQQQQWTYRALSSRVMGAVNTRSTMGLYEAEWLNSVISDAFPNDVGAVLASRHDKAVQPGRLVIKDDHDLPGVMKPYKAQAEAIIGVYHNGAPMRYTIPKPGSVILSYIESKAAMGHPVPGQVAHVFYWKWNDSVTFTFMDQIYDAFWSDYWPAGSTLAGAGSNPYAHDMVANIIWFSTGRNLPDDVFLVHEFRQQLFSYEIRKSLVIGLLEFAEIFGADSSRDYRRLDRIDEVHRDASRSYLAGEFPAAYERLKGALEDLNRFESEATRLKDRTLFWVYLIQWFVTMVAFLSAGLVVWTLMIRRRLYREVEVTRSRL